MEHRAGCLRRNVSILHNQRNSTSSSSRTASSSGEPACLLLQKVHRKRLIVRDRYDEAQIRLAALRAMELAASTTQNSADTQGNPDVHQPSPPPPPLTRVPSFWVTTWSRNVIVGVNSTNATNSSSINNHHLALRRREAPRRRGSPPRPSSLSSDEESRRNNESETATQ